MVDALHLIFVGSPVPRISVKLPALRILMRFITYEKSLRPMYTRLIPVRPHNVENSRKCSK